MEHEPDDPIVQNRAIMARARALSAEYQMAAALLDEQMQRLRDEENLQDE